MKKKQLQKFIEIYKKQYGEELSEAEALKKANSLLRIYQAVYGTLKESKNLENEERERDNEDSLGSL